MSRNEPAVLPSTGDRSVTLTHLRNLLREKHPACELKPTGVLPTGLPAIEEKDGGLHRLDTPKLITPIDSGRPHSLFHRAAAPGAVRTGTGVGE